MIWSFGSQLTRDLNLKTRMAEMAGCREAQTWDARTWEDITWEDRTWEDRTWEVIPGIATTTIEGATDGHDRNNKNVRLFVHDLSYSTEVLAF